MVVINDYDDDDDGPAAAAAAAVQCQHSRTFSLYRRPHPLESLDISAKSFPTRAKGSEKEGKIWALSFAETILSLSLSLFGLALSFPFPFAFFLLLLLLLLLWCSISLC